MLKSECYLLVYNVQLGLQASPWTNIANIFTGRTSIHVTFIIVLLHYSLFIIQMAALVTHLALASMANLTQTLQNTKIKKNKIPNVTGLLQSCFSHCIGHSNSFQPKQFVDECRFFFCCCFKF